MHRLQRHAKCSPAALLVLVMTGCAATYTEPVIPQDHPANPAAQAAPPPERSGTLDLSRVEPLTPPVAAEMPGMPHGHAHGAAATPPAGDARPTPPSQPGREPPSAGGESTAIYTCPMHPEVVSDKPGRCPKCGMQLVKKAGGEKP
jgi:heavy metal-binding protein